MVEGRKLDPEIEYLIDFKVLKEMLNEIITPLDHIHLNNFPPFDKINPSSENLAMYIYKEMEKRLSSYEDIRVSYVSVAESDSSVAYYMEE
jgi:6-pyruvoyltetrahydropterin/6-carboxytetrahydropterin synthase